MITSERMAAIDRNAESLGVPRRLLMESSGNAIARNVSMVAPPDASIDIIAGRGNNGGDGLVAARFLKEFDVTVTLLGTPAQITTDIARANWGALEQANIPTRCITDASSLDTFDGDVIVDALLGTGVDGPVREPIRSAIELINHAHGTVISVDVPSGLDPDTGEHQGSAVEADHIVTFHDRKPAHQHIDVEVSVEDIGIPEAAERFVGPGDLLSTLHRDDEAHKGDHGEILIIGGGPYVGAPALSGIAALRTGADLVHLALPELIADTVLGYHPEFIPHRLPGTTLEGGHLERVLELSNEVDVVVIGPGLGDSPETTETIDAFLDHFDGTTVVDADALQCLSGTESKAEIVATPHAGEFVSMGFNRPKSWRDAMDLVTNAAQALNCSIILKGHIDIISDGEQTRANRTGNPGMTTGGTGDVLTGVTAAMLARHDAFHAACISAWLTGAAGDHLARHHDTGFLASEVADAIPQVCARLE